MIFVKKSFKHGHAFIIGVSPFLGEFEIQMNFGIAGLVQNVQQYKGVIRFAYIFTLDWSNGLKVCFCIYK